MRFACRFPIALLALAVSQARATPPSAPLTLTAAQSAAVRQGVRSFTESVAHDVRQQGPIAWSRYFEDSPAFFMAVNGRMIFPSGAAARAGIPQVARTFRRVDLHWGSELRIDPLTPTLAMVAIPWRETLTDAAAHVTQQAGYFTATAESRNGHWRFRDAHWSAPVGKP